MGQMNGFGVMPPTQTIQVQKHLSGGVHIAIGDRGVILSPQDALQFAAGILKAAGCGVEFTKKATQLVTP